jgi:hypothetical protein
MAGDYFSHCADSLLKRLGALIGMTVDLDANEDREAEADPITAQHGPVALDVSVTFEPLDPA